MVAPDFLRCVRVAVDQQSSVARDLMADLLAAFGAQVTPIGRSETFVPINTEAHRPEDIALIANVMTSGDFDALVMTDGDAAAGRILRGDVLGLITARYLSVDTVVAPVTAGSAIELAGGFGQIRRTRVGSPFVIAGMKQAKRAGASAGFEANGGSLLGIDIAVGGRVFPALPTRDAMLPILATLAAARQAESTLATLSPR